MVAGESGMHRFDHRGERGTTGGATLALKTLALGGVLEQRGGAAQPLLGAGEDDAAPTVAQAHDDACRFGEVGQGGLDALRALAGDAQHRGAQQSAAACDDLCGRSDEAGDGEELGVRDPGERLGGNQAL
jgi:hypothetical protein